MKVCADCKHYRLERAPLMKQDFCGHEKSRHPITGKPRLCVNARGIVVVRSLDDGYGATCFPIAQFWEGK